MRETIEQIMIKDVYKIDVKNPLLEAIWIIHKYDIKHLPIVSGKKLVGMLNKTDIMHLSYDESGVLNSTIKDNIVCDFLTIQDIMIHHTGAVSSDASIEEVTSKLIQLEYQSLPVSDQGELVGVISTIEIIKHLQKKYSHTEFPEKYTEERPWGNFQKFCQNVPATVKIINVKANEELSLQYHKHRNEFWKVIQGEGSVIIDGIEKNAIKGDEFIIPAQSKHQIKTTRKRIQVLEISYGFFDENDIVRLADKYQRETLLGINSNN